MRGGSSYRAFDGENSVALDWLSVKGGGCLLEVVAHGGLTVV